MNDSHVMCPPDDDTKREELELLRSSMQYTVGEICKHASGEKAKASRQTIATLTEIALQWMKPMTEDMRYFAKHARRTTVGVDDIKLLARKDKTLTKNLESFESTHITKLKAAKRKRATASGASSKRPAGGSGNSNSSSGKSDNNNSGGKNVDENNSRNTGGGDNDDVNEACD